LTDFDFKFIEKMAKKKNESTDLARRICDRKIREGMAEARPLQISSLSVQIWISTYCHCSSVTTPNWTNNGPQWDARWNEIVTCRQQQTNFTITTKWMEPQSIELLKVRTV